MAEPTSHADLVDELAQEFLARYRQGEHPPISEFVDRCPDREEEIRELFPALVLMEKAAPQSSDEVVPPAYEEPQLTRLGDFRIVREAGRGGMGIVYEAEQVSLGRRVALKVLPQHLLAGEKQRKRFEREAKAAARLHHTNIVPVFGVGVQDGLHYYVMQFIDGLGLDAVIVELRKLRQESEAGQATTQPKSPASAAGVREQDGSAEAVPASALAVAHFLLSGQFEHTAPVIGFSDNGSESSSDGSPPLVRPSLPDSQPFTPAADTGVGQLSETAPHSFALPGQSTTESHGSSSRRIYWESVARMGVQTAQALQYAHDQGIIHRDIKPANLLLDTKGTVWVTDFGLAKAPDQQDLTHTGDVLGTLRYMAPEQFEGQADARSDVYALGLTLYELLALQPAFDQQDRHQLVKQVTFGTPVRLRSFDPQIPRDLETIVHKAIDREPSQRYQAAGEIAADLQRYLGDEPIQARWVSPVTRFTRWCRRNTAIAVSALALSVLLLVVGVGGAWWAIDAEQARQQIAAAEEDATDRLFQSYLAQAQASRWSRRPGQRLTSLKAVGQAAALLPRLGLGDETRLTLRNEAIAAMGLIDLVEGDEFTLPVRDGYVTCDSSMTHYASADLTHHLCIRRVSDHQTVSRLPKLSLPTNAVPRRFTPCGRYLVGYDGRRCWVWDTQREEVTLDLDAADSSEVNHLASFSCRGDRLAVISPDRSVQIIHLPTTTQVQTLPTDAKAVYLSSDGSMAAVAFTQNTGVQIWDCESGRPLRVLTIPWAQSMAWSPDDRLLACGTDTDNDILVWSLETGTLCAELVGHQNGGLKCCFSDDGSVLASSSWDGSVRLWDPIGGRELLRTAGIRCELHDDGACLLTSGDTVQVRQLVRSPECQTLRAADDRSDVYFEDCDFWWGGPLVACARGDGLRIWDLQTNREVAFAPVGQTMSVLFHQATGSLISSGTAGVYQWPIIVSHQPSHWRIGPPRKLIDRSGGQGGEANLVQSHDGNRLAAVVDHDSVVTLTLAGIEHQTDLNGHTNVSSLAVSRDGSWVASGTRFGTGVRIWDTQSGRAIHDLWPECLGGTVAASPDGNALAAWNYKEVRIFDTRNWKLTRRFMPRSPGHGMAWSADGAFLVHSADNLARLVDARSGTELATFTSPNEAGNIQSLCLSGTNGRLAIVYRNALEVWDLRRVRRRLAELNLDGDLPPLPPEPPPQSLPKQVEFDLGVLAPAARSENALEMARLHTLSGDWQLAADEYERVLQSGTTSPEYLFEVAASLLISGQPQRSQDVCRAMLQRHGQTGDARTAYVLARTAALLSDEPFDPRVRKLATMAVQSASAPWYEHTLALVCYRENDLDQARLWLERSAESNWEANVANWIALAMVYHRLGNTRQRDHYWDQSTAWLNKPQALHPHDRVAVKLLSDEARQLLTKEEPVESLSGEDPPLAQTGSMQAVTD